VLSFGFISADCSGTPASCNTFNTQSSCAAQSGCSWKITEAESLTASVVAGTCSGTPTECPFFTGNLSCVSQSGCQWATTKECLDGYVCLDSDNPKTTLSFNNKSYGVELISASDTTATIKVTNSSGASQAKEINEGATKEINGLYVYVKSADESNLFLSVVLKVGNMCEIGYTCLSNYNSYTRLSFNNKSYGVELISASDTSAVIKVGELRYDGKILSNVTKEINEGTTKEINGLNVYLKSADRTPDYFFRVVLQVSLAIEETCSELVDFVAYPKSFLDYYGLQFFTGNKYNFSGTWNDQNYTVYTAGWYAIEEQNYYYIEIDIYKFENKSFNAYPIITDEITKDNMCVEREFGGKTIYICNYAIFYDDEGKSKHNQVIWARNNVFVGINTIYSKNYITEEQKNLLEHKKLQDFINSLKNNEFNWETTNFDLNSHFESVIEKHLDLCPSDLELGKLPWNYYCKVEPVICPEYGYQKHICIAWDPVRMEEISRERQKSCRPGICSGCYVPRWFDHKGDNICIPYGFRFESQIGWTTTNQTGGSSEKLSVAEAKKESDDFSLLISEEEVATLWVKDWGNQTYTFRQGDRVDVNVTGWNDKFTSLSFVATEVVYDKKDENSYVVFDFTYTYLGNVEDTINAYCDIDGNVKPQKTKVEGEWAKCQNNYECDSNLCSYGECVELKDIVGEVSAFKTIVMKFFCRLTNLFNNENYEQCLIDNGIVEVEK
jgi:hypothetical protein